MIGRLARRDGSAGRYRKLHGRATPLVGGLAIALPDGASPGDLVHRSPNQERLFAALLVATGGFWLLGFIDDRRGLRPLHRLIATFLLFSLILMVEPKMSLTALDFGGSLPRLELGIFAVPFTLVCLVGFLNAINMADGRNGLVLGIAVCWAYGLGEYAHLNFQPFMHFLLISLVYRTDLQLVRQTVSRRLRQLRGRSPARAAHHLSVQRAALASSRWQRPHSG